MQHWERMVSARYWFKGLRGRRFCLRESSHAQALSIAAAGAFLSIAMAQIPSEKITSSAGVLTMPWTWTLSNFYAFWLSRPFAWQGWPVEPQKKSQQEQTRDYPAAENQQRPFASDGEVQRQAAVVLSTLAMLSLRPTHESKLEWMPVDDQDGLPACPSRASWNAWESLWACNRKALMRI